MYWFQRWFEKIANSVRSESNAIQEAIQEQKRAIRDANHTSEEQQREIGVTVARAIETASNSIPSYKYTKSDKEYSLQRKMLWATAFGALAAAAAAVGAIVYANIANSQLDKMNETYREMQKQTCAIQRQATLMQQQTTAAQESLTAFRGQLEPVITFAGLTIDTFNDRFCDHNQCFIDENFQNLKPVPPLCLRIQSKFTASPLPPTAPFDIDDPMTANTEVPTYTHRSQVTEAPLGVRMDVQGPLKKTLLEKLSRGLIPNEHNHPFKGDDLYIFWRASYRGLMIDNRTEWHIVEGCTRLPDVHVDFTHGGTGPLGYLWAPPESCHLGRRWNCIDGECGEDYIHLQKKGNFEQGDLDICK